MHKLAIAALVCLCACAAPRVFAPADDAAVRGVLLAQRDAWNRGDLAGFMAGYARTPALVFTSGGQIRRGWDETFAKYRAKYGDAIATMGHLDFELLSVQALGADGAIVLGRWKLVRSGSAGPRSIPAAGSAGPSTGTTDAAGGVFSVALERTPDGWRVVHDHTSADPPSS